MCAEKDIHSNMSADRDQALTPSSSHWKCLVHKGEQQNYTAGANPPRGLGSCTTDVEGQFWHSQRFPFLPCHFEWAYHSARPPPLHLSWKLTVNIKLWSVICSRIMMKATVSGTLWYRCIISFDPHCSPLTWAPFLPFCSWESWASEKLNNLAKVKQIISLPL